LSKGYLITWELIELPKVSGEKSTWLRFISWEKWLRIFAIVKVNPCLNNHIRYVILHAISLFGRQGVPPVLDDTFKYLKIYM
jgi:hypothetical protein